MPVRVVSFNLKLRAALHSITVIQSVSIFCSVFGGRYRVQCGYLLHQAFHGGSHGAVVAVPVIIPLYCSARLPAEIIQDRQHRRVELYRDLP